MTDQVTGVGKSWKALIKASKSQRPLIAGIINATPDSFSDGGRFLCAGKAVEQGLKLLSEGADLLDIGAESTRPGAAEVPPETEWERLKDVISGILAAAPETVISVDTRHSLTAKLALEAGAKIINDVSGFEHDPAMLPTIVPYTPLVIGMHTVATPELMQTAAYRIENNAVEKVAEALKIIRDKALQSGILSEALMLDVGIGFGKSREANFELLRKAGWFEREFDLPFCWGVSRKSLFKSEPDTMEKRIAGSLAAAVKLAGQGVSLLRVHDVAATVSALETAAEF